jgi:hypothetical protein
MKKKNKSLFFLSLIFPFAISAQTDKVNTNNIGLDPVTQGFYVGFNYSFNNYEFGLDLGSSFGFVMPLNVNLSIDNAIYFGKENKFNIKSWHVNARAAYSKVLVENKPQLLFLIPSFGKVFSLNEKLGINVELGYAFQVLDDWGEDMIGGGTLYHFGGMSNPNVRVELKF